MLSPSHAKSQTLCPEDGELQRSEDLAYGSRSAHEANKNTWPWHGTVDNATMPLRAMSEFHARCHMPIKLGVGQKLEGGACWDQHDRGFQTGRECPPDSL